MVEAKVVGDDLRHWKGKIFGPVSILVSYWFPCTFFGYYVATFYLINSLNVLTFAFICTERHLLRGRYLLRRHYYSSRLPIQASQDEVRHKDMASKYQLPDWSHLPRYSEERVDTGIDNPNCPDFLAGIIV